MASELGTIEENNVEERLRSCDGTIIFLKYTIYLGNK